MNIAFFGASVTAQKNGYAIQYKKYNTTANISIHGYGSTQLFNAGVCFIDEVLKKNPDVVFLDFIGSVYFTINDNNIKCLETILRKCSQNQTILIFLIFINNTKPDQFEKCVEYKKLLDTYNSHYLDIHECLMLEKYYDVDYSKIFRDTVHLTDYGSDIYAKIIYENINFELMKKQNELFTPEENIYYNIKKLYLDIKISKYIKLCGLCKIIGIFQKIGPFSCMVEITNDKESKKCNIWDQWCYFERTTVKFSCDVIGETTIKILDEDFDRSLSKCEVNWNIHEKKLLFDTVFYIGDSLKLIEYE